MSEDPIGFAAGDENIRRYVGNGVATRLDSNGLDWNYYWSAYFDFLNPWDGAPPSVDCLDQVLSCGTMGGQVVGVSAGVAAGGLAAAGAVGISSIGLAPIAEAVPVAILEINIAITNPTVIGIGIAGVEIATGYPGSLSPDDIIRPIKGIADDIADPFVHGPYVHGLQNADDLGSIVRSQTLGGSPPKNGGIFPGPKGHDLGPSGLPDDLVSDKVLIEFYTDIRPDTTRGWPYWPAEIPGDWYEIPIKITKTKIPGAK